MPWGAWQGEPPAAAPPPHRVACQAATPAAQRRPRVGQQLLALPQGPPVLLLAPLSLLPLVLLLPLRCHWVLPSWGEPQACRWGLLPARQA